MLDSSNFVVMGYSGHSYVIIEAIRSLRGNIVGYTERKVVNHNPYGLPFLGTESLALLETFKSKQLYCFPSVGDNELRRRMTRLLQDAYMPSLSVISQQSTVSITAQIGDFCFVSHGARINALASIGDGCIVNTNAVVEHECDIGNYCHVAPGAVISGGVKVGSSVMIGASSVIKQGIRIGDDVIIGAGSVVINDIPKGETWVGVPAKNLIRRI